MSIYRIRLKNNPQLYVSSKTAAPSAIVTDGWIDYCEADDNRHGHPKRTRIEYLESRLASSFSKKRSYSTIRAIDIKRLCVRARMSAVTYSVAPSPSTGRLEAKIPTKLPNVTFSEYEVEITDNGVTILSLDSFLHLVED